MSDAYDPNAVEGDVRSGSQYLSKRDVKVIAVVLVVLFLGLWPIYNVMLGNSENARCVTNIKAISTALGQYVEEFDGRYPAIFDENQGTPALNKDGIPFTWASSISKYMRSRDSFLCPSALADEASTVLSLRDPDGRPKQDLKPIPASAELISYGFYIGFNTFLVSEIENPNQSIVVTETTNRGASGTLDPEPYRLPDGTIIPQDGFVIGWDNSNVAPNDDTKMVTRLAFKQSVDGLQTAIPRHSAGNHGLSAAGGLISELKPSSIAISRVSNRIVGPWAVPASLGR